MGDFFVAHVRSSTHYHDTKAPSVAPNNNLVVFRVDCFIFNRSPIENNFLLTFKPFKMRELDSVAKTTIKILIALFVLFLISAYHVFCQGTIESWTSSLSEQTETNYSFPAVRFDSTGKKLSRAALNCWVKERINLPDSAIIPLFSIRSYPGGANPNLYKV